MRPVNMIECIPAFKSKIKDNCGLSDAFIKAKLNESETNQNIIRLARGEGRQSIVELILDANNFFDWGVKSNHALNEQTEMRDFLDPDTISRDLLKNLIYKFRNTIKFHSKKSPFVKGHIDYELLNNAINNASHQELVVLKEFLCFCLHTSGRVQGFTEFTPWISTAQGENRFMISKRFGFGRLKTNKYVILDYWVSRSEERKTYINTDDIIKTLKNLGITWYFNMNREIMVKYALFPDKMVGYYYFEDNELKYYYINHHYLDMWTKNSNFIIGDNLYIDQTHVEFPANNPYQIIYLKNGSNISLYSKR